jgi:hypothetical protein
MTPKVINPGIVIVLVPTHQLQVVHHAQEHVVVLVELIALVIVVAVAPQLAKERVVVPRPEQQAVVPVRKHVINHVLPPAMANALLIA